MSRVWYGILIITSALCLTLASQSCALPRPKSEPVVLDCHAVLDQGDVTLCVLMNRCFKAAARREADPAVCIHVQREEQVQELEEGVDTELVHR